MRTRLPERSTEPSITASTWSSRPICESGFFFLRHAVGEILLLRITGKIREGQHRDRFDLGQHGAAMKQSVAQRRR